MTSQENEPGGFFVRTPMKEFTIQANHEGEQVQFVPSVRVVVNQPVSLEEAAEEILSSQNGLDRIELTRSFWIVIGPPQFNRLTAMLPGGKIVPSDETQVDNLV